MLFQFDLVENSKYRNNYFESKKCDLNAIFVKKMNMYSTGAIYYHKGIL